MKFEYFRMKEETNVRGRRLSSHKYQFLGLQIDVFVRYSTCSLKQYDVFDDEAYVKKSTSDQTTASKSVEGYF